MKLNRTQNARRNIASGLFNKVVTLFFPFAIRMAVIRVIGAEYLGLGSLFQSVLQVLNITELGFSSAVVHSMYRPIAGDDTETLCAILNFYRKVYFAVGIIIALAGLCLLPFLPKLIRGPVPAGINMYVLYVIYLSATVVSYLLFAYKNSLINAYQRADVISNINTAVHLATYGAQLLIIIATKNYYFYAAMLVAAAVLQNICTEAFSRKLFPEIACKGKIGGEIKNEIKVKVKGLLINKLCQTSRNSFDSIFISAFLGLRLTAIYNNYYYIMNAVVALLGVAAPSVLSGVGNSIVTETQQKNYSDMRKLNFIYMWLAGWCAVCLLCLYQPFTELAFGKGMQLPFPAVVLLCLYFYVLKMGDIRAVYSDARGLWWENRWRAVTEAALNLALNLILGKSFGVYGIIAATLVSLFFINFVWGSTIIYRHYFTQARICEYYLLHLLYASVTAAGGGISWLVCRRVALPGMAGILARFAVCVAVPNAVYLLCYSRFPLFKTARGWIMSVLGMSTGGVQQYRLIIQNVYLQRRCA